MTVLSALELFITRLNTVIIPQKGWGEWKVCVGRGWRSSLGKEGDLGKQTWP